MAIQQNLQEKAQKVFNSPFVREPFHILTITLLSLLLPLSFLLLARLSCTNYLLSIASSSSSFYFPDTNPSLLYLIVSLITIATLIHSLTDKITPVRRSPRAPTRPRLYTAWFLLCVLQICVGLGIEASVAAGTETNISFGTDVTLLSRVIFFLGLHETMLQWCRLVVKPVVDDAVLGGQRKERWVEKAAMAVSFGSLWYWRLRDEIECLVAVAEAKREMLMGVAVAEFVGWWLYYLTVTIGMIRLVKGFMWVGMSLFCGRLGGQGLNISEEEQPNFDVDDIEEKV
ncbi:hypothetical protein UlMin_030768 [Ulmus minor]